MAQAIETRYKGYRFRSRTEARWAVFFDSLGLEWEYELQGFNLGEQGLYLPDFWLPQVQMWVEVKGSKMKGAQRVEVVNKLLALSTETGYQCLFLEGQPALSTYTAINGTEGGANRFASVALTMLYVESEQRFYYSPADGELENFKDLKKAVADARGARFEHGESGAPKSRDADETIRRNKPPYQAQEPKQHCPLLVSLAHDSVMACMREHCGIWDTVRNQCGFITPR